jgi:hypothetical protein
MTLTNCRSFVRTAGMGNTNRSWSQLRYVITPIALEAIDPSSVKETGNYFQLSSSIVKMQMYFLYNVGDCFIEFFF